MNTAISKQDGQHGSPYCTSIKATSPNNGLCSGIWSGVILSETGPGGEVGILRKNIDDGLHFLQFI